VIDQEEQFMKRRAAVAALALAVPLVAGMPVAASQDRPAASRVTHSARQDITLDGAGANSIEPFFSAVFYNYHKQYPNVTVNYSPAGSSVGVSDIEQNTVAFGDSEIPMAAKDLAKAKGTVLQLPVDLGGIAISYNVPGAPKGLRLDGSTLAAIFEGVITNWDSPALAQATGVSNLPNLPIVPVHRADSSGPGWDLDDYLIQNSSSWVAKTGTSVPSKTWPLAKVGVGEQLNSGVASYIAQTPGAIGFVEYGYALEAGFANAAVRNKAGDYVTPSATSIGQAGLQAAKKLSWSNFDIIDEPGAGTYPLTNFSWTLLYQKQANANMGVALQRLFTYVITTGQLQAAKLGYAPLPLSVVAVSKATLAKVENSAGQLLAT
jgi:phosphate transport system substrate-binding protein